MSVALLECMLAATLVPLMFILGLFVLFLFGAWPMGILPSLVVVGLLTFVATGLIRMARASDAAAAAAK